MSDVFLSAAEGTELFHRLEQLENAHAATRVLVEGVEERVIFRVKEEFAVLLRETVQNHPTVVIAAATRGAIRTAAMAARRALSAISSERRAQRREARLNAAAEKAQQAAEMAASKAEALRFKAKGAHLDAMLEHAHAQQAGIQVDEPAPEEAEERTPTPAEERTPISAVA